jgi:SAM-dependent methyltransferase
LKPIAQPTFICHLVALEQWRMNKQLKKDIIQWDTASWSKALRLWDKEVDWKNVKTGLELGGREGGLALWLALKGVQTVCSDLMDTEATASKLHEKHKVTHLITYQDIDATDIPYENHFDVIVFKSIIGGIGRNSNIAPQREAFNQMHKALKPGGKLLFAENLIASPVHQRLRSKYVTWGDSWRYVSIPEMNDFLSIFSSHRFETTGFLGALGRSESQRKTLAKFDNLLFNRVVPDNWNYICYGVAVK